MKTAVPMCREYIARVVKDSADSVTDSNPRGHTHLIIVMEELAELAQEISKVLRSKARPVGVLEELADVQIGIYYVQEVMGVSDEELAKAVAVKIKRLEKVVYGRELGVIPFGWPLMNDGEGATKG